MHPTDIVNQALAKIGGQLISTIEDEPRHSMAYEAALGEILEDHDWDFATVGPVALASVAVTDPKPTRFDYCHALPGDFLRRVTMACDRIDLEPVEFRIQGPNVWTNTETVDLTYITNNPSLGYARPSFIEAMATLVAEKLARTLLQDAATAERMRAEYDNVTLPKAKKNDLQNNPGSAQVQHRHPYATSPLIQARRRGRRIDPDTRDIEA